MNAYWSDRRREGLKEDFGTKSHPWAHQECEREGAVITTRKIRVLDEIAIYDGRIMVAA